MKLAWFFFSLFLIFVCDKSHADKNLDIRIAFGYKDTRPERFVGDRYERLTILQELLKPCVALNQYVCGFQRNSDDGDLLEKVIPADNEEILHIHVWITASSVGPDDQQNRTNPFQTELSSLSKNNFFQGLQRGDATFYIGHSRNGGGPDFSPPKLDRRGHVDYASYQNERKGLSLVLGTLKQLNDGRAPSVLGVFSCSSTKHFAKDILKISPQMKLITVPELLYYSDALKLTLQSLSEVIERTLATSTRGTRSQVGGDPI